MKYQLLLAVASTSLALSPAAVGQSLMSTPPPAAPLDRTGEADTQAPLRGMSLILVEAPKPRTYEVHDQITIIISESSKQSSTQKLDTEKDTTVRATLEKFPDLAKLIEGELTTNERSPIAEVDVSSGTKFEGDGKFERADRFTDRITATIIDVKPNGVLVVEARRTIRTGKEVQNLVLSGSCRREDVTGNNTVLSSQLADLAVLATTEGDVKDSASKGFITRIFEAVFNF